LVRLQPQRIHVPAYCEATIWVDVLDFYQALRKPTQSKLEVNHRRMAFGAWSSRNKDLHNCGIPTVIQVTRLHHRPVMFSQSASLAFLVGMGSICDMRGAGAPLGATKVASASEAGRQLHF